MAEDEERDSAVNLDNASAKLSIAASHPTAETLQELESIFVDINWLTGILLSKAHAACEDATTRRGRDPIEGDRGVHGRRSEGATVPFLTRQGDLPATFGVGE